MKEVRLSKLVRAMRQSRSDEKYYLNIKNYMVFSYSHHEIRYLDEYRMVNVDEIPALREHSVRIPPFTEKDMMKEYLLNKGEEEEMRYEEFAFYLRVNEAEAVYEAFKKKSYREKCIAFAEENDITYIDDLK